MATLQDGQRFERYQVIRYLGSGTAGESYEADDTILQRKVALKLLHPWAMLTDASRRQFFREMQGLSILTHPYIAAMLDYGELDGRLYSARRYVGPGSLLGNEGRTWFRPPLSPANAFQFAHQLAQVLAHIHNNNYLHGSLTFSNILVLRSSNPDNEPNFSPFLLADAGLTHFVRRFGQPRISQMPVTAAPEQSGGRVTPASDQYALAVILYFWLAGRLPFTGTAEEVEHLKLTETISSLTALNPHISSQQENILRHALSVYPDKRYPSILAFTETLLASLPSDHQEDPESTPPDAPQPLPDTEPLPEPASAPDEEAAPIPEELPKDSMMPVPDPSPDQPTPGTHLMPYLTITLPGQDEVQEIRLAKEHASIGHAGASDILLDQDPSISRHHALLQKEGETYVLYDQDSISGVFVNGEKLVGNAGYALFHGDTITIGAYILTFRLKATSIPTPLPEHILS